MRKENNDYKMILTDEGEEQLIYVGPLYHANLSAERFWRYQFICAVFSVIFVVVYVASCFVEAGSMASPSVTIPYGLLFLSACALAGTAYRFSTVQNPMKRAEHNRAAVPLRISSACFAVFALLTCILHAAYMAGNAIIAQDIVLLCILAALAVAALILMVIHGKVKITKTE